MSPEEKLKDSFLVFLWYVWTRVLLLPPPTRIQNDIARYLADGPRKRFISAFRGVGKTFLTAAYIVWRLWKDPNLKIMVVSANERFARTVATFVHTLINAEDAKTREPVPWTELRARPGQKNSTMEFDVGPTTPSKDPSVWAVGITGQMTGGRADVILSDDVEVPGNSATETQREALQDRIGEYAAIAKPNAEVIFLGTFQSMMSVYRGLRAKGYAMRIWPARYPLKKKLEVYEDALAPLLRDDLEKKPELMQPKYGSTLGGAPTDPERFNVPDLLEREIEWGESGFQLQFMLDTSLTDADRYPLKTRDLIVMDTAPNVAPNNVAWGSGPDQVIKELENVGFDGDRLHRPIYTSDRWEPYTGSVMTIDPSGEGKDETAYAVSKFLNGMVFIRRWGGFRDGYGEATLKALAEIAKEEEVNLIRIERNFGDGMFAKLLEPHLRKAKYLVPVEEERVSGNKELRIVSRLKGPIAQHRVVMDTQVIQDQLAAAKNPAMFVHNGRRQAESSYSGLIQLTHMTLAKGAIEQDDRIEALGMAVGYWTDYLNADAAEAEAKAEEKATKEFEDAIWRHRIGKAWTPPSRSRGRGRPTARTTRGRRR